MALSNKIQNQKFSGADATIVEDQIIHNCIRQEKLIRLKILFYLLQNIDLIYTFHEDAISTEIVKLL